MVGRRAVGWVCVCAGAWGRGDDGEQSVNSSREVWLEGEAACQHAQLCVWGRYLEIRQAGRPSGRRSVLGSALFSAPLWGDALAPPGRGEPERACPHARPPWGTSHRVEDSFSFSHRGAEQWWFRAKFPSLSQVLPTRPAVPPCTRSAPSAASTWWASAQSPTACTSAPTPSPVRTSGTRPWLSPAAAPTPVSIPSHPAPPGCSRWGGLFWWWGILSSALGLPAQSLLLGVGHILWGLAGTVHLREGQLAVSKAGGEGLPPGTVQQSPSSRGMLLHGRTAPTSLLCQPRSRLPLQGVTIAFPHLCTSSAPPAPRFWGS